MFPSQKFVFKTDLPPEKVKTRIEKLFGCTFQNNRFMSEEGLSPSNSPILGNMALLYGQIEGNDPETSIKVKVKLHFVGKIGIVIGLFFGVLGVLFAIFKSDPSQLVGLIPIGIIYPLVLINFSFDSSSKIILFKKTLNIK